MNRKNSHIRTMSRIALMVAFICVCSFIQIPFLQMPVTLQLFGIFAALYMLRSWEGGVAVLVYVALGLIGLPIFSGFVGGAGRLTDATGGFIIGFILIAVIYPLLFHALGRGRSARLIATAVALTVFYTVGVLFYAFVYIGSAEGIIPGLLSMVLPFLPIDAAKLALAWYLAARLDSFGRGRG